MIVFSLIGSVEGENFKLVVIIRRSLFYSLPFLLNFRVSGPRAPPPSTTNSIQRLRREETNYKRRHQDINCIAKPNYTVNSPFWAILAFEPKWSHIAQVIKIKQLLVLVCCVLHTIISNCTKIADQKEIKISQFI